jgi:hypothetical protein
MKITVKRSGAAGLLQQWRKDFVRLTTFRRGELRFTLIVFGWIMLSSLAGRLPASRSFAEHVSLPVKVGVCTALYFCSLATAHRIFKGVLLHETIILPRFQLLCVFCLSVAQAVVWADLPQLDLVLTVVLILLIILLGEFLFRGGGTPPP